MMHYRTRMARGERGVVVPERARPRISDKTASVASRLGISIETYRAHVQAGEKWCSGHRAFHPASLEVFPRDRSRPDGIAGTCRAWHKEQYQSRVGAP